MHGSEYQRLAQRTQAPGTHSQAAIHAAIGMSGDLHEVVTAHSRTNLKEELGDILWYVAEACNALGLDMEELISNVVNRNHFNHAVEGLIDGISQYSSLIEKKFFYHQEIEPDQFIEGLFPVVYNIQCLARLHDFSINDIMFSNIDKLRYRYPKKFDTVLSEEENRDREKEAIAMEKKQ